MVATSGLICPKAVRCMLALSEESDISAFERTNLGFYRQHLGLHCIMATSDNDKWYIIAGS